jgi:hypothetical protein
MKNFFYASITTLAFASTALAQTTTPPATGDDGDFDKKFRFGLRISPQPTWFKSGNGNVTKLKTGFGFGFGLVGEIKLSDLIRVSTGIGGDIESGSISFRNAGFDPNVPSTNNEFASAYVINKDGELLEAAGGVKAESFNFQSGAKTYILKERKIKTTHVTIPITLKMMTKEYSGFRYFGQFGVDLAFRTAFKASDVYSFVGTHVASTSTVTPLGTIKWEAGGSNSTVPISKDGSLIPVRLGLNVGIGTEYRIAGSTSLFMSINYFSSFTNLMRNDSKYAYTAASYDATTNTYTNFKALSQALKMNAIRINLGVMF